MFTFRRFNAVPAILVAAAVLAVAGCGTTEAGPSQSVGTTIDVDALLGPINKATGTPIKIGFVYEGKTAGLDTTKIAAGFHASVQYANERLGGINGHEIQVDECSTENTPSGATKCGIQMVNDEVAAVLVPASAQDAGIFDAISSANAGIPYFTYLAAAQDIMIKPGGYLLVNPIATVAAPAKIAHDDGVKKAAIIVVDVPAATGPLTAIAEPLFKKAGVELDVVPISTQTADMTPQVQQAISDGAEQIAVVGNDEFVGNAIKTVKQLGFDGKVVMVTAPSQVVIDAVGEGGLDGVVYVTSSTEDPDDPDVKVYRAAMQTYMKDTVPDAQSAWSYALVVGLVDALKTSPDAIDAASVAKGLGSMPAPLPLPLGGGLTYQCGAKLVALLPNSCTDNALTTTLDAKGHGQGYQKLDVRDYLTVG